MSVEETIGVVNVDGTEYEIDWPFCFENETVRDDFAVIYQDGRQVGDFVNPNWGPFIDADQVLDLAEQFISMGGLE